MNNQEKKKNVRTLTGIVASDKMDKTVTVHIEIRTKHPLYGKFMRRRIKLLAHDEQNVCKQGDTVTVKECRPLSWLKRWKLVDVIKKAM